MIDYTRLWHGGIPGLRVGDIIRPPDPGDTRHLVDGCPECDARKRGSTTLMHGPVAGRVYVTSSREYARIYAAGYPRGALYQVEPIGNLEADPEAGPGGAVSWMVAEARVVCVYDPVVIMSPKRVRAWARRWS